MKKSRTSFTETMEYVALMALYGWANVVFLSHSTMTSASGHDRHVVSLSSSQGCSPPSQSSLMAGGNEIMEERAKVLSTVRYRPA